MAAKVRGNMETTITLTVPVKKRIADVQYELRMERGRAVTYNEVIEYLLDARSELARRVTAEWEAGA